MSKSIRSVLEKVRNDERAYEYDDDDALKDIEQIIDEALHSNMPSGYSTPDYRAGFNRAESNLREALK